MACSLSPVVLVAIPAEARVESGEPINGNQELCSHPSLPYIYYGGIGEVITYDHRNGAQYSQPLGATGYVGSIDINGDGTLLAAAYGSTIYFLALTSGVPSSVSQVSSASGNIKSLCFGPGNSVYVSYESSRSIDSYNSAARVGTVAMTSDNCILEADDTGSFLLAGNMGSADATTIVRYGLTSDPSAALVESGSYAAGGKLAQFEAASGKIYIACTGDSGIQVVSLSTMAMERRLPMQGSPSGVTVSRDKAAVFGVSIGGTYPPGQISAIYAFDASGAQISIRYVSSGNGAIAPTPDRWAVAIASPLQIVTVGPDIEANAPASGAAYVYSPSYVQFNITHDPVIDASAVMATIDATSYPVVRMTSQTYQVNLTSPLSTGDHAVSVSVSWGGTSVPAAWTFTSGSSAASAQRPEISMVEPVAGSVVNETPSQIVLGVDMPEPPPFETVVTVELNGLVLNAVASTDDHSHYVAALPLGLDLTGSNIVNATATADGFVVNGSWQFEVDENAVPGESYELISYGDNFSIPSPVVWTEQRDFGGWELAITGPSSNGVSTNVFVDIAHDSSVRANLAYINTYAQTVLTDTIDAGDPAEMVGDVNYTAISNLTAGVWKIRLTEQGIQEAYALIVDEINGDRWLIKCSASDTSFIDIWPIFEHMISGVRIEATGITPVIAPPGVQGYAYYRVLGDYQLMVPDNWTLKRDVSSGDIIASLKLTGPKVGEFHVTVLLQNGTDAAVSDDQDQLLALVNSKFLPELGAQGINASVYEEPRILSISGHTALVFSIRWTDLQNSVSMVREIFYIVDEQSQRYWMFICESPEEGYPVYAQVFDKVAQSFTPLSTSVTAAPGGLLSDPTTALMIAVLVVTGASATIVFLVARRYRSK